MPEGGKKHKKRQAGLSEEAEANSPRWRIKSSCVWLIPGDVPGRRSVTPSPAPRPLMVFRPKPIEPVQIATHKVSQQVSQTFSDSVSNNADLANTDLSRSDSNSSDSNSSGSSRTDSAWGLVNEKTVTAESSPESKHTGLSAHSKQAINNATQSTDSSTDKLARVHEAGVDESAADHAQSIDQNPENTASDKESIVKSGVLSGAQADAANSSYDRKPLSSSVFPTIYDKLNQAGRFNYRKLIPALLLLLLLLWLGSLGKDYFAGKPDPAVLAVSRVENNSIAQAVSIEAGPAVLTSVPEEKQEYHEEPGHLPAVDISLSKIGRRSISGLQMLTHTVVRGDTLWDISKAYLKNPFRYPELAKLSHIKNPDLIYPGETIHIHIKIKE